MEEKEIDIPLCPICNSVMEKKLGKFGYFWGCKNFKTKRCKGTIDIPKEAFKLECIDYNGFVKNNPTKYLLELIDSRDFPAHIKKLKEVLNDEGITKGTIYRKEVEGKISGVFDYLRKHEMYFEMSKLAYWFYKIEGDLQGKFDYWLNRKPATEYRNESFIKKSLIDYWNYTPLNRYIYYAEEYEIGEWKGEFGGYKVDLVAKEKINDELIFIEIKSFKKKGKEAMPQLVNYIRFYNSKNENDIKVKKSYVVAKGYPRGIFDDDLSFEIGMIGYVVEEDKISFIPWKII